MKTVYDQASSVCPECGGRKIIQDGRSGETVCEGCGLVLAEPAVNTGPEWRAFSLNEKENRTRVGSPLSFTFHDKGLSTTIGSIDRDAMGKRIPQETRYKMSRLNRWNTRARRTASEDRNLAYALGELQKTSEKLHIPSIVRERAALIYRRALKKGSSS
ncbi:unnamed protein product, partial [marine sediment metagenome]